MGPLDLFWHVVNLFGPAVGLGLLASGLAKLLWWRELRGVAWLGLALWVTAVGAVVTLLGLVLLGRDGRMATYGALVVSAALVLWWRGWR